MGGKIIDAVVMFGSDNRRSLILSFDGAAHTSDGGMYLSMMPVVLDHGQWTDLRGEEITLEWLDEVSN